MSRTWTGPCFLVGCFAMAASITYATHAVTSRFDRIEGLLVKADETVRKASELHVKMREDLVRLKQALPDAGTSAGEAGGRAVNRLEDMLHCADGKPGCDPDKGARGIVNRKLRELHPD